MRKCFFVILGLILFFSVAIAESDVGRYQIYSGIQIKDLSFPILLDTKTGKTWKFVFDGEGCRWAPLEWTTPIVLPPGWKIKEPNESR